MTRLTPLLARNAELIGAGALPTLTLQPPHDVLLFTCLDPRADPAGFLGLQAGEVMQVRNAGGRVSDLVLRDVALIAELAGLVVPADEPLFEIAVVHHTECGTGFLADAGFRASFARLTGAEEAALQSQAVVDPSLTVRADVALLHACAGISDRVTVSGHVHDLATGAVATVVPAGRRGRLLPATDGERRATAAG